MARRYGTKTKTERKWKKITRMNINEVFNFMKHLEKNKGVMSKVYDHAKTHLAYLEFNGKVLYR